MSPPGQAAALLALTLTVALAPLAGCSRHERDPGAPPTATVRAPLVTLQPVQIPDYSVTPATVVPARQVRVASRLTGFVRGLTVHEGQSVKAGALLLTVDPADVRARVRAARATLQEAQAALRDAQSDYRRFKALYEQGAVARREFDRIRLHAERARSQVAAAAAELDTARAQLDYAEVRAPMSGVVVRKDVDDGDLAAPGRTLLVLENPEHLQVRAEVGEETYRHLSLGATVRIDTGAGTVQGRVERLVSSADPVTHTFLVKVGLPAGSGLHSGDYVSVQVRTGAHTGLVVPRTALRHRAGIPGVFVVDRDGVAHYRLVRPGAAGTQGIEILSGLAAHERIVAAPPADLRNGDQIVAGPDHPHE